MCFHLINIFHVFCKTFFKSFSAWNFNYVEILLNKDGNFFNIITSAFSNDGQFLKTDVEEKKSKRVTIEGIKNNNILVIYL
jgi:hypothetical protein